MLTFRLVPHLTRPSRSVIEVYQGDCLVAAMYATDDGQLHLVSKWLPPQSPQDAVTPQPRAAAPSLLIRVSPPR